MSEKQLMYAPVRLSSCPGCKRPWAHGLPIELNSPGYTLSCTCGWSGETIAIPEQAKA